MPLSTNPAKRGRQMAHIVQRPTKIIPLTVIQHHSNGKKITEIVGIKGNFQNKNKTRIMQKHR